MGKTIDLVKKIRDTKGTFHAKMGSIKDRSGMDLTEAEDIKKRFLLPWTWGISSGLLQQSAAAAPYPWMRGISSRPPLLTLNME